MRHELALDNWLEKRREKEEKRCQEELLARLRLDITFPQHRTVSGSGQKIILTLLIPLAGHAQDVLLKETHDLWHR